MKTDIYHAILVTVTRPAMPAASPMLIPWIIWVLLLWFSNHATAQSEARVNQSDHWSFQPLLQTKPPQVESDWIRTDLDRYVRARQMDARVRPSGQADRRTCRWSAPSKPPPGLRYKNCNRRVIASLSANLATRTEAFCDCLLAGG